MNRANSRISIFVPRVGRIYGVFYSRICVGLFVDASSDILDIDFVVSETIK